MEPQQPPAPTPQPDPTATPPQPAVSAAPAPVAQEPAPAPAEPAVAPAPETPAATQAPEVPLPIPAATEPAPLAPASTPAPATPPAPTDPTAAQPVPPAIPGQSPVTTAKKKRFPKFLKIIIGIFIVIVLFIVIVSLTVGQTTKKAVKVSDKFVSDLQKNDATDAYSLTSAAFKKSTNQAQLTQLIGSVSPALQGTTKITEKAISKSTGNSSQAVIIYTIKSGSDTKYVRVVLEDNNPWEVQNFRSSPTPLDASSDN